jgi:hypothetical protein
MESRSSFVPLLCFRHVPYTTNLRHFGLNTRFSGRTALTLKLVTSRRQILELTQTKYPEIQALRKSMESATSQH